MNHEDNIELVITDENTESIEALIAELKESREQKTVVVHVLKKIARLVAVSEFGHKQQQEILELVNETLLVVK